MSDEVRIPVGDIVTGWGERVGARRVRLGRMPEEARRHLLAGGRVILTGCPPASTYGPTERVVRKRGRYWMAMVPTADDVDRKGVVKKAKKSDSTEGRRVRQQKR